MGLNRSSPHSTATDALVKGSAALIVSTKLASEAEKLIFVNKNPNEKQMAEINRCLSLHGFPSFLEKQFSKEMGRGEMSPLIYIQHRRNETPIKNCCTVKNKGDIPQSAQSVKSILVVLILKTPKKYQLKIATGICSFRRL
jgi:hypothetical protein